MVQYAPPSPARPVTAVGRRPAGSGLVRITVATARRRVDLALPEYVRVAELLPILLRHAGESAADDGEEHGGWALRRADGAGLRAEESLAHQRVGDGEVLHLAPRVENWPEPEFDDVIDAIAVGARGYKPTWTPATTRRCGMVGYAVLLAGGLPALLWAGPPWSAPAFLALGVAVVSLGLAVALARAFGDGVAGAICGVAAALYAAVGGGLALASNTPLADLDPAHGLLAAVALLTVCLVAHMGVAQLERVFVAGVVCGIAGAAAALLGMVPLPAAAVAAVIVSVVVLVVPAAPLLAIRIGRLPLPELPRTPDQIMEDRPVPEVTMVFAAVAKADEALTGLVCGLAIVAVASQALLLASGETTAIVLAAVAAVSLLLRSRPLPAVRQRGPLLVAGAVGLLAAGTAAASTMDGPERVVLLAGGSAVAAVAALAAGLIYSRRAPSPYLGRFGDFLDFVAAVAVVPLATAIAGMLGYARGLFG